MSCLAPNDSVFRRCLWPPSFASRPTSARTPAPSSFESAFGFCQDLLGQPHCQIVEPQDRHWDIFKRLCIETETRGPRVTDAWYAALAIEWGCEWVTLDRDYARFPGLHWRVPEAK